MCGVAGLWLTAGSAAEEELARYAVAMADAVAHRGPDDAGVYTDQRAGVALSHRRLSILDLSPLGHQPMCSPSGRYVVVFNGEIYNFRELRAALRCYGTVIRGESDTAVLVGLLDEYGVERTVERLNGMFAIGVWDAKDRKLHLVRDRLGIKPLYYSRVQGGWAFCSELHSLRALPMFEAAINPAAVQSVLRWGYVRGPDAIYQDTVKCRPGTIVTLTATGGDPEEREFWTPLAVAESSAQNGFEGSFEEAVDALEELLGDSVARQLVADVPVGAFLSGGIDSSTVVALMCAKHSGLVRTFSIGFGDEKHDEAPQARELARHFHTEHTELYVSAKEAQAVIPKIPSMFDEPFADSSQIPTYLVAKLAREHVKVVLSGDGGDELFGGYPKYARMRNAARYWRRLPAVLRRAGGGLAAIAPGFSRPFGQRSKVRAAFSSTDELSLYEALTSQWYPPADSNRHVESNPALEIRRRRFKGLSHATMMMVRDQETYLPDDILTKVDRATMAVSLEARVPILDHRIVELAASLPEKYKTDGAAKKRVLRAVLARHAPCEVLERPKRGFAVPLAEWLRTDLKEWADDLLGSTSETILTPTAQKHVEIAWREHCERRSNRAPYLWNVLMLAGWLAEAQAA